MRWKVGDEVTQDIKNQVLEEARENFKKFNRFTPDNTVFDKDISKVKYFVCSFLDRRPLEDITPKHIEEFCQKSPRNIFDLVNDTIISLMKERVTAIDDSSPK